MHELNVNYDEYKINNEKETINVFINEFNFLKESIKNKMMNNKPKKRMTNKLIYFFLHILLIIIIGIFFPNIFFRSSAFKNDHIIINSLKNYKLIGLTTSILNN